MRKTIKKLLPGNRALLLSVLSVPAVVVAQYPRALPAPFDASTKVNYVRTWDAMAPESDANALLSRPRKDVTRTTQYFDGLGRALQTVIKQGSLITNPADPVSSANAVDMVTAVVYDEFGRETFKYLPFASTATDATKNDGLFKLNPLQQQAAFYNTQMYGINEEINIGPDQLTWSYSRTNYEPSPLNRVDNSYAPGAFWVGTESGASEAARHNVRIKYYINTFVDSVKIWTVSDPSTPGDMGSYAVTGSYADGTLYKTVTIDEHDKQTVEFKDKDGKVIFKKVQLTGGDDNGLGRGYTGWLCTYYIYDDFGRLRCVIQPRGVELLLKAPYNWVPDATLLAEQCFRYEYDQRNRMIVKKTPGAAKVLMVYDSRDRLALTQDGNLAAGGKWMYTQYDELNRPIATGLWTTSTAYSSHVAAAAAIPSGSASTYPAPGTAGLDELTHTFYDDYSWRSSYGNPLSGSYDNSYDSHLQAASNTTWPYAQANVQSTATRGLVTGTRTKVPGTSAYLYTVNIYDNKARLIQACSQNITGTGAVDILTTQYNWAGRPLVTVQKQEKAGAPAQTTIIVTQTTYDELGRVVKTEKKLSNTLVNSNAMSGYATISTIEYDALGQLKYKKLGGKKDFATGTYYFPRRPLQTLQYDYNIRGWLLGVNRYYTYPSQWPYDNTAFGYELGYDNRFSKVGRNFKAGLFNGNITGMIWKTDGDDVCRKYDFTYDAAGRMLKAMFEQRKDGSTIWDATAVNYAVTMGDGTTPQTAYDANGNIKRMQQWGMKLSGSVQIDDLTYNYASDGKSNRLLNISDAFNDAATKLGDFRVSALNPVQTKTTTTADYSYDANGNMVKDQNKDIVTASGGDGIVYNYLNLPELVTIRGAGGNKGTIAYTYDAAGNKLKKITTENPSAANGNKTITTTTTYLGGLVYESKTTSPADAAHPDYTDKLQFISHEEGRIRLSALTNGFEYDYFLKDHLGNVRAVITEELKQDVYPKASMETAQAATEDTYYSNIGSSRYAVSGISGYPADNTTSPNDYVAKTNGNDNKIGPGILLRVMSGDKFNVSVSSWYKKNGATPDAPVSPLSALVSALSAGISGLSPAHGTALELQNSGLLDPAVTGFFDMRGATETGKPKAYLNWILLDDQLNMVNDGSGSGADAVGTDGQFKTHVMTDKAINKNGYLYIYVSNETPNINVFFDNLQVNLKHGIILEETHYYPFGLTMAGISSKALNNAPENKRKYNGIEFNEDLDLDIYDAYYRNLDPQTGRWWQIDPETDGYEDISPYASMYNNPIRVSDPLGNEGDDCCGGFIDGLVQLGKDAVTFAVAAGNAFVTNQVGGVGRGDPSSFSDAHDAAVAQAGATFGDVLTLGGTAGVTAGSVVVEAGTLGFASPAVVPLLGQQYLIAAPTAIKNLATTFSNGVPNPHGSRGKPDHQKKVDDLTKQAQKETKSGETVVRERKIQGHDSRRRPDVQIVDKKGKARKVFEAERKPNSKRNINREKEYKKLKVDQETHPVN